MHDVGLVEEQPVEHVGDLEVFLPHCEVRALLQAGDLAQALVRRGTDVAAERAVGQFEPVERGPGMPGGREGVQEEDRGEVAQPAGIHMGPRDAVGAAHELAEVVAGLAARRVALRAQGLRAGLREAPPFHDGQFVGLKRLGRTHPGPGLGAPRGTQNPRRAVEAALRDLKGIRQDVVLDPIILAELRLSIRKGVGSKGHFTLIFTGSENMMRPLPPLDPPRGPASPL